MGGAHLHNPIKILKQRIVVLNSRLLLKIHFIARLVNKMILSCHSTTGRGQNGKRLFDLGW